MKNSTKKKSNDKQVFKDFNEYWHYARVLTNLQRDAVFAALPESEQKRIGNSFVRGGWCDVMMRDQLDWLTDAIEKKFGFNLIECRAKALSGYSVYMPRSVWDYVQSELSDIDEHHKHYLVGGVKAVTCRANRDVVILLPEGEDGSEE